MCEISERTFVNLNIGELATNVLLELGHAVLVRLYTVIGGDIRHTLLNDFLVYMAIS